MRSFLPQFCFLFAMIVPNTGLASTLEARLKIFKELLAEQWEYRLKEEPEFASVIGDHRYDDRWSDLSLSHVQEQKKETQSFLDRFKAIDTNGFAEQDSLSHELIVRDLADTIKAIDLKLYEMPIDQFNGMHLMLSHFVSLLRFEELNDYENYLKRLNQLPGFFDTLIEVLKQGRKDKLMPPRFLLEKVVTQCQSIAAPSGEASAFSLPILKFPSTVSASDQKRLHADILKAVDTQVRPAYQKFQNFIAKEYAPYGRTEPGLWALPNGEALYRFDVEQQTTTHMSPDAIHKLGLSEVKRIELEQTKIAKDLGYKNLQAMREDIKKNPKFYAKSREQIIDLYKTYIEHMQKKLPEIFGLLPKAKVEVLQMEAYREKESAAAEYNTGTADGKRAGRVYINTSDFEKRSLLSIESTAYHEAIPGHHMQLSIAQVLPGLPPFRQNAEGYTAYVEGWALYAEHLGKELGFFQDPLSYFGHLDDELMRAVRLVLDTGVHHLRWSRKQMVDYFHAHSSQDEPDVEAEVDRYIAYPAQALAYKLGQLKILELRERAKKKLGDKFNLRDFHDEILNGGALPLDILELRIQHWIEK